jgi:hypothetical protein
MLRWLPFEIRLRGPFEIRLRGSPPAPPEPLLDRPTTVIGLLSDLARAPKQAFTLALAAGAFVGIVTLCLVSAVLITSAAKGIPSIPLHYLLPSMIGSTSLLTFITIRIRRRIKRLRASRADVAIEDKQSSKPSSDRNRKRGLH